MIDHLLRYPKERVLEPLARGPLRHVAPTTLTLIACGLGIAAGIAAWQRWYEVALVLWLINRIFDGLDGTVARVNNRQSDLGGYLDMLLDVVVYTAIPLGLALGIGGEAALLALVGLLASYYVNATSWMYLSALLEKRRVGAATRGELTTVTMPGGLIEGFETILFYTAFLLFPTWIIPLFWLKAVLLAITILGRVTWAVIYLRKWA
jgi:phosphatidylglycerophosphate synthase